MKINLTRLNIPGFQKNFRFKYTQFFYELTQYASDVLRLNISNRSISVF